MAPPKSSVWKHFMKEAPGGRCKMCLKLVPSPSNTTNLWKHLARHHGINQDQQQQPSTTIPTMGEDDADVDEPTASSVSTETAVTSSLPPQQSSSAPYTPKRPRGVGPGVRSQTLQQSLERAGSFGDAGHKTAELNNALMFMVCKDNLALSTPEHEGFRRFCKAAVPLYRPPSRPTLTYMIDAKFEVLKNKMKEKFSAVSDFTLTTDVWTNMQTMQGYLGTTVHFLPEGSEEIASANIGVMPLNESHTGDYIAEKLHETLLEWSIPLDKVALVVTDSGANMIAAFNKLFGGTSAKHIACFAHTLNLVVTKSFEACTGLEELISKVKRVVTFFKQSHNAADELKNLQVSQGKSEGTILKLVQEVATRWNSRYEMVDRFIDMSHLVATVLLKGAGPDMLTGAELAVLKEVRALLKPISVATKEMSGEKYTTISKVIPIVHLIRQVISSVETSTHPIPSSLKTNILAQMDRRFGQAERVPIFAIATLLDPRFKRLHFQSPLAVADAVSNVSSLVRASIRRTEANTAAATAMAPTDVPPVSAGEDIWSLHDQLAAAAAASQPQNDAPGGVAVELRQFLNLPVLPRHQNPIAAWRTSGKEYPHLHQIALKKLSAIATSVPAERLFSKAGQTTTKLRNRLTGKHLSKLLFLGSLDEGTFLG